MPAYGAAVRTWPSRVLKQLTFGEVKVSDSTQKAEAMAQVAPAAMKVSRRGSSLRAWMAGRQLSMPDGAVRGCVLPASPRRRSARWMTSRERCTTAPSHHGFGIESCAECQRQHQGPLPSPLVGSQLSAMTVSPHLRLDRASRVLTRTTMALNPSDESPVSRLRVMLSSNGAIV